MSAPPSIPTAVALDDAIARAIATPGVSGEGEAESASESAALVPADRGPDGTTAEIGFVLGLALLALLGSVARFAFDAPLPAVLLAVPLLAHAVVVLRQTLVLRINHGTAVGVLGRFALGSIVPGRGLAALDAVAAPIVRLERGLLWTTWTATLAGAAALVVVIG